MKIIFYIFGFPVHFLGLMIAVGVIAAIVIAYFEAKRKMLDYDKLFDLILYCMIAGIVGARLFYILFYDFSYYLGHPIEIFKITEGGLSIHGGLITAVAAGYLYIRKKKQNFFQHGDALAPGVILAQGIGRVGCDVFGTVMKTPLFWGVNVSGQLLHPAQVYEFLLDYLVFFILWRKRKHIDYNGQIFIWYIILFSVNRGIVEFFRTNPSIYGWFSVSHLLSAAFIAGALILLHFMKRGTLVPVSVEIDQMEGPAKVDAWYQIVIDIVIVVGIAAISLFIYYSVWK